MQATPTSLKAEHDRLDAISDATKKAVVKASEHVIAEVAEYAHARKSDQQGTRYATGEKLEAVLEAYEALEAAEAAHDDAYEAARNAFDQWWENRA